MNTATQAPPEQILMQLGSGFWASQCVSVATRVGLFDQLDGADAKHPRSSDVMAGQLGLDANASERLLRGCANLGLVSEPQAKHFCLTDLGQHLTSSHPQSMRGAIIMMTDPGHWNSWTQLEHTVRTGQAAYQKALGVSNVFDYFKANPEESKRFDDAMASMTHGFVASFAGVYSLEPYSLIADIGGGHGQLLSALLQKAPKAKGLLFDQPAAVEAADAELAAMGVKDRVEKVGGNFFESIPTGPDLYLLKHILHDWNDEQCHSILSNLKTALKPQARFLIVEMLLSEPPQVNETAMMDLNMMVMTGGRERTAAQYQALVERAGMRVLNVIPTQGPYQLIECGL